MFLSVLRTENALLFWEFPEQENQLVSNALQVKFAYALTTHKSQGGQWKAVFIDQGYLKEDQVDAEYIRWLYTAITRASHELFLVNFHELFFTSA